MTFMISDGIMPSNNGRGYVLRRIIRRAVRHGRKLGIKGSFLPQLAENVIDGSRDGYPELEEKRAFILSVIKAEEGKFEKTYEQGMDILEEMENALTAKGAKELSGEDAFRLYDTYGFPLDNTREILEEKGFTVDEDGFNKAMQAQREAAREDRKQSGKAATYMGAAATVYEDMDPSINSTFVGYGKTTAAGKIVAMAAFADNDASLTDEDAAGASEGTDEDTVVEALSDGQKGAIITDETPFYGTMGGQVGDKGIIVLGTNSETTFISADEKSTVANTVPAGSSVASAATNGTAAAGTASDATSDAASDAALGSALGKGASIFVVETTEHVAGNKIAHIGHVAKGMFKLGDTVTLKVDPKNRLAIARNHSATHLLQKALREVLGTHVEQSGSYQDAYRTRFDFSHFQAMTPEELKKVEDLVNEKIAEGLPVVTDVMGIDEARKTGAMALFGEKYGDKVRVVKMGDFSIELCGGTHVKNTSEIGSFKIVSESGVAAGVRRIEALTGENVRAYYEKLESELNEAAGLVRATPDTLADHIKKLQDELKAVKAENESMKAKEAREALGNAAEGAEVVNGVTLIAKALKDVDMNGLRDLGDQLKAQNPVSVIVLISEAGGKVSLMSTATDAAVEKGAHAGNLVKAIAACVGGGGGGRPTMAQAGGKNPAGIPDALKKAKEVLKEQVKG